MRYPRPYRQIHRVSLVLCLASTLPAMADVPGFCGGVQLLATPGELAATPREDYFLELMALDMGGEFTAGPVLYDRLVSDVATIRELYEEVREASYWPPFHDGKTLTVTADATTATAIGAGTYHDGDCFNEAYGLEDVVANSGGSFYFTFKGVYDLEALGEQYADLPGVLTAEPAGVVIPAGIVGNGPSICALAQDDFFVYLFDAAPALGQDHVFYLFTTEPGSAPRFFGRTRSTEPAEAGASWELLRNACRTGPKVLPGNIFTFPTEPSADQRTVLHLYGEVPAGCEPEIHSSVSPEGDLVEVVADLTSCQESCTEEDLDKKLLLHEVGPLSAGNHVLSFATRTVCGSPDGKGVDVLQAVRPIQVLPRTEADVPCSAPGQPAATLLVPYFETDLADPSGPNTLVSVGNAASEPVLARVVLWTDRGQPTLGFTLYLEADGVQPLDLRRIFNEGSLPVTGPGTGDVEIGRWCADPIELPTLDEAALEELRAKHTGRPSPVDGLCYGRPRSGSDLAVGYLTVDAVNDCSYAILDPTDPRYFEPGGTGLASNRNVLSGDFFYIDDRGDAAQGLTAVGIRADSEAFLAGEVSHSFYQSVSSDRDDERLPLGGRYRARYVNGGGLGMATELIVWTEGATPPRDCEAEPDFVDFRLSAAVRNQKGDVVASPSFPFEEHAVKLAVDEAPLGIGTGFGQVDVAVEFLCSLCDGPLPPEPTPVQSWLIPVLTADGRFSLAVEAVRLDGSCSPR